MPAAFLSLNSATNTFTMSPTYDIPDGTVFMITDLLLSDGPQTSLSSSSLKVTVRNQPPRFLGPLQNQSVYAGGTYFYSLPMAEDPDGNSVLTSIEGAPDFVSFSSNGGQSSMVFIVGMESPTGVFEMTLRLWDGAEWAEYGFNVTTKQPPKQAAKPIVNIGPPTFSTTLASTIKVYAGKELDYPLP